MGGPTGPSTCRVSLPMVSAQLGLYQNRSPWYPDSFTRDSSPPWSEPKPISVLTDIWHCKKFLKGKSLTCSFYT